MIGEGRLVRNAGRRRKAGYGPGMAAESRRRRRGTDWAGPLIAGRLGTSETGPWAVIRSGLV